MNINQKVSCAVMPGPDFAKIQHKYSNNLLFQSIVFKLLVNCGSSHHNSDYRLSIKELMIKSILP